MAEIPVWKLIPSSGAVPSEIYDPVSQAGYTEWELDDEARVGIIVPDSYRTGADFYVTLHESSISESARHMWQITALLLRPGVHTTGEAAHAETQSYEFESAAVSDQLSARTCAVTGSTQPAYIGGAAITQGDLLSFTIKRIAASTNEDPGAIKVFALSLSVSVNETAVSECAGRIGSIIDTVRDLFNESLGGFLSEDFILRSINRCQQDLAQAGYWRRESWIAACSGHNEVNLLALLPDYQDIHQARFSGMHYPMKPLPGFQEYQELQTGSNVPGTPEYYIVQNDRMYVWPSPSADVQSGYCIYHSYLPDELTCSSANPNPALPKAHDMIFVYFTLKQAFLRDRHAPGADIKFNEYSRLYEQEKQNLLGEADPPGMALRCYR